MSIAPVELGHNLSPKAFKCLWVKYVTTVNDKNHCTNCLRGRYGKVLSKHNSELTNTPVMLLDEFPLDSFSAIYVCGVINKGVSEIQFDRHRDVLEPLIKVSTELGRLPFEDEFEGTREVIAAFGSMKQAYKLIRKVTGAEPWDSLRQSRIDDLKVYLALARFPKRPSFAQMPLSMQRDIKEFFGNYKSACEAADALLFEAGNSELVDAACLRAKVGRLTSNALYLHRSAISSLEPVLRVFEGCAKAYLGDVDDANVVKLHSFSGKVSYLVCPKFETFPHPPIRRTIKLSLRNLFLQCIDHFENKNPLLLDQKERMIESDHPWRERFARFSVQELVQCDGFGATKRESD